MIIGHSIIRSASVTVATDGSGTPDILSPSRTLIDSRPDTATRLQWMTGTVSTSDAFYLRVESLQGAITPGIVGIMNISLPVGTLITVSFRRSSDTPGTYPYQPSSYQPSGQRVVRGTRGERTAWIVIEPGASPIVGVQIEIHNDVNGSSPITDGEIFTIGEVVIGAASEVCPSLGVAVVTEDPTSANIDPWSQPYVSIGTPRRRLQFALQTAHEPTWRTEYAPLLAKMDRGQTCAYVLDYRDIDKNFSADILHANAMIGRATTLAAMNNAARNVYKSGTVVVVETPIPT